MGPRHARLLGWAKSFTSKLSKQGRDAEDTDALGAVSLFWNLVLANMPTEVIQEILDYLEREKLPDIATRDIPEGMLIFNTFLNRSKPFYQGLDLPSNLTGKNFSTRQLDGLLLSPLLHVVTLRKFCSLSHPRICPLNSLFRPIHTDASMCRWSLSWTVARDEVTPGNGGSSYVDVGLRAVVRSAPATMIAAQPQHPHGTTHHMGSVNYGFVIPFSKRLADGYRAMLAKGPKVLAFTPKAEEEEEEA